MCGSHTFQGIYSIYFFHARVFAAGGAVYICLQHPASIRLVDDVLYTVYI